MNEQLDKVTAAAGWFENILKYESAVAIAVAILVSWFAVVSIAMIVRLAAPPTWRWAALTIRALDIAIAWIVCACMWPNAHPLIWGALVGCASPILYAVMDWAVSRWIPSLKPLLSLRELTAQLASKEETT